MQKNQFIFELILNIGLLVLVANLLSKFRVVQDMIVQEKRNWQSQVLLSLIFGGIIILSTYTGINIGSYTLNTRVIGAMSAGLLGGPLIGLYASLIGAVYVYYFSAPQAFAAAAAFSTVLFGLLGGGFCPYFQKGKWKYKDLFLLTCFAEVCNTISILRDTTQIQVIPKMFMEFSLPMMLLNSAGMLIFISSFNNVFIRQDVESSRQLQLASGISEKIMPLLYEGLHRGENIHELASVILKETDWSGVMITNRTEILEWQQKDGETQPDNLTRIPVVGREAMENGKLSAKYNVPRSSSWYEWMKEYSMIAAPFVIKERSVGCMIVWMKKKWVLQKSEQELLQHLVTIGSFQIAVAELEHQEKMRQRAELKALQFQVNPHFLFNALNTISCVCREEPEKARELLVVLANYFRYNLNNESYMVPMEEEMEHVRDYLEIEKARFEEKLVVNWDVPEQMEIPIPILILQPIVENAVRHGIGKDGKRTVGIWAKEESREFIVRISDRGKGFSQEVLDKLERGENIGKSVGLSNVHKRMKSIYGEENGLKITSSEEGSCVELHFSRIEEGRIRKDGHENRDRG